MENFDKIKSDCFLRYTKQFEGKNKRIILPMEESAVIITGNGSEYGLGRYLAGRLREADGCLVVGIDKDYEYQKRENDLCADLTDSSESAMLAASYICHREAKKAVCIINNAAETYMDWFENLGDNFAWVIQNNLTNPYLITSAFVKETLDTKHRKYIINIGSMAYCSVLNSSAAYCASKAGLMMLTKCEAWELARKNYIAIQINPSSIAETGMEEKDIIGLMRTQGLTREEATSYRKAGSVLDKQLTKEDIYRIVKSILLGEMDYLSGTAIDLRGGAR